ncbi:histidinol-phosphate transaminase [Salinisphaera orenii]|uniref:histidinol-phosphate transaminase n=1 Tax=Salinisphaera orenii TaxID=856731 RepID=UPI000DBE7199
MSNAVWNNAHAGIHELHAYVPGKPIADLERELGVESILKLASNENPFGMAPAAQTALAEHAGDLRYYPDGNATPLKQKLAARYNIEPACITLGNGSNDILELAARVFLGPDKNAVLSQYAFAVYPIVTRAVNAEARVVPALGARASMPFGHDLEAMLQAIDANTGVVFLASPNNPTGTWVEREALEDFIAAVPSSVVVVLDEAYVEYQDPEARVDSRALLERHDNLIVTRTFSKIYGLAGLRVGYGLSSSVIADLLNRIRQPFNVHTLGQIGAAAALDDTDFVEQSIATNCEQRPRVERELAARGFDTLPSAANFVTFDCGSAAEPIFEAMLHEGVIVRSLASYDLPNHIRVTIGRASDNDRFLAALDAVTS